MKKKAVICGCAWSTHGVLVIRLRRYGTETSCERPLDTHNLSQARVSLVQQCFDLTHGSAPTATLPRLPRIRLCSGTHTAHLRTRLRSDTHACSTLNPSLLRPVLMPECQAAPTAPTSQPAG